MDSCAHLFLLFLLLFLVFALAAAAGLCRCPRRCIVCAAQRGNGLHGIEHIEIPDLNPRLEASHGCQVGALPLWSVERAHRQAGGCQSVRSGGYGVCRAGSRDGCANMGPQPPGRATAALGVFPTGTTQHSSPHITPAAPSRGSPWGGPGNKERRKGDPQPPAHHSCTPSKAPPHSAGGVAVHPGQAQRKGRQQQGVVDVQVGRPSLIRLLIHPHLQDTWHVVSKGARFKGRN